MNNYTRDFSKKRIYTNAKTLQKMRDANIVLFILWYKDELIVFKDGSFRLTNDNSVVLFNNLVYDHSKKRFEKALHTLDFVTFYFCNNDFNSARKILYHFLLSDKSKLEELANELHSKSNISKNETFDVDKDEIFSYNKSLTKWIFGYLHNERKIDRNLIAELISRKLIAFEEKDKNILFLTYDDNDNIVSLEKKGTYKDVRFSQTISKESGISFIYIKEDIKVDDVHSLCVFESTVDLLSYITLYKADENSIYISARGASKTNCIFNILNKYTNIQYIDVCADNDSAGSRMFNDILARYENKYIISPDFPIGAKDWNEYLKKYGVDDYEQDK